MSFSDKPTLTGWQKFGCAVVAGIGIIVTFFGLIASALGACPECDSNRTVNFLLFPGTAIFFLAVGILMAWHFMRDKG